MEATIWGTKAEQFAGNVGDVIAILNGRISEFDGFRIINVSEQSSLELNPKDMKRSQELSQWYKDVASSSTPPTFHKIDGTIIRTQKAGNIKPPMNLNTLQILVYLDFFSYSELYSIIIYSFILYVY